MQNPIISSLLDTDLYKFTMQQAVLHQFPSVDVEYKFKCRNGAGKIIWTERHEHRIKEEISELCKLNFTEDELSYLKSLRFMKSCYIDFLRIFKLQERYIDVKVFRNELYIAISGPWLHTILFEVPVLAIVEEVFLEERFKSFLCYEECGIDMLHHMIFEINRRGGDFKFAEFGTRRRASKSWHWTVVANLIQRIKNPLTFVGTSNVSMAKAFNIKPIGTMAHEWLQAGQALTRVKDSQKFMFQKWADEYRGDLGIALSDVVGMDAFLKDFDPYFAKLFDGCRHDSGDPDSWCSKLIKHYESFGINPKTKTAVFSDGLTVTKAIDLFQTFNNKINVVAAIGTNLTNNFGLDPLNIVIKMTKCNGVPVAKISDSPGKEMCSDDAYSTYLKQQFKIK